MDLETENRLASLLLEEARRLQLEADREGVRPYLQKPNVRHRPNSRFLTATLRGVQQANRVVEVNEMWRAREKELALESKMKRRIHHDHHDSRGEKRKIALRDQSSSPRIEQEDIAYNSSYSDQEDGLGDDDIEKFLHSRVKRGRGAIGSRMDEPGPFLNTASHNQDNEPIPDMRVEEKWERRFQGPCLRSKSPDPYWHRETLDGEPSSPELSKKKEKKKEKSSEQKDKKVKRKKKDKKSMHHHHRHHHHNSRQRE
ncbi:hypothetical protein ABZP36_001585 [Zizania latifolia]